MSVMSLLQIWGLRADPIHGQVDPVLGTQVASVRPDPLAMKIQSISVPSHGAGRGGASVAVAVFCAGLEQQLNLAIGDEASQILHQVKPLPQLVATVAVAIVFAVV